MTDQRETTPARCVHMEFEPTRCAWCFEAVENPCQYEEHAAPCLSATVIRYRVVLGLNVPDADLKANEVSR